MCGRYAIIAPVDELVEAFDLQSRPTKMEPRYNAAPTQELPVVVLGPAGRTLVWMGFGLVPSWSRDPRSGAKLINARAETVAEKPSFRGAFRTRRCLVPASGFYEWKKGQVRVPHFIRHREGRLLAFAGLWERWDQGPEPLLTFTILTCAPNALVAGLHDRMPVILPPAAYDQWLRDNDPKALAGLLLPAPDQDLEAYPVSPEVNTPKHDHSGLILPA